MDVNTQVKIKFHGVDFPVVNLNSEHPLHNSTIESMDIEITPKVFYPDNDKLIFKIVQELRLKADGIFELFVLAIGTFELDEKISEIERNQFVNANAPAIMFPYMRSFITTLTANLGNVTGTLTIPTQYFKGILEEITNDQI